MEEMVDQKVLAEEIVDQKVLANDVADKIAYDFLDRVLVKPFDVVKVKKEFTRPKNTTEAKPDKNGVVAADYSEVETEVLEVESEFREGIVLKIPVIYEDSCKFEVGDVIVFRAGSAMYFDLLKDSMLVRPYDVIAIKR